MEMNPILTRIQARMDALGWSRADISRRTSIPYHRLNPWFVRNTIPNGPDLEAVAKALRVTTGHLVNGDPVGDPSAKEQILTHYDQLTEDGRRQLEGFARFLVDQQASQGTGQD